MATKTKITTFLDQKKSEEELAAVQGYVPTALRQDVIDQMKKDKTSGVKVGWNELLDACLRQYLAERQNA